MALLLSFAFACFVHGDEAELEFLGAGLAVEGDLRLHRRSHIGPLAAGRTFKALSIKEADLSALR